MLSDELNFDAYGTSTQPSTTLTSVTITARRKPDGSTQYSASTGEIATESSGEITMTQDSVISPDPTDDWKLMDAIDFAIAHTRAIGTDEASKDALAHLRGEVAQLYMKLHFETSRDFNIPDIKNHGSQGTLTHQQLTDRFDITTWVLDNSSGQPGGVGQNVPLPDGTFQANFTVEGFESYYWEGDNYSNYVMLHELAHETQSGQSAWHLFASDYVTRTGDSTYQQYGPSQPEWKNTEVWANQTAREFATALGLDSILNPTYGYTWF